MASKAVEVPYDAADSLFARVGAFLTRHRLSPEPAHYAFAYEVVSNQDGVVAQAVAGITDGGVRLSSHDIARLGGHASAGAPLGTDGDQDASDPEVSAAAAKDAVIVRALSQVEGFTATVQAISTVTSDFGRELMASAEALQVVGPEASVHDITRLTQMMLERVRRTERRLESAKREAHELRSALDEARGDARVDPLTQLPNRRAFDEAYAALAPDAAVIVAMCDVDHFKRVNDTFGHAVGDRVLKVIGQALGSECDCLVARYGGEEFALLFHGNDIAAALAQIERARTQVASRRFRVRETDAPIGTITLSAGVATGNAGDGRGTLMGRADKALYTAKDAGRDRVEIAPNLGAER